MHTQTTMQATGGIRANGFNSSGVRLNRDWLQLSLGSDVWSLPQNGCCQITNDGSPD